MARNSSNLRNAGGSFYQGWPPYWHLINKVCVWAWDKIRNGWTETRRLRFLVSSQMTQNWSCTLPPQKKGKRRCLLPIVKSQNLIDRVINRVGAFEFYKKVPAKVQRNEWKKKGTEIYIAMCNQKRTRGDTIYFKKELKTFDSQLSPRYCHLVQLTNRLNVGDIKVVCR